MSPRADRHARTLQDEDDAEALVVYDTDLIAQLEHQLRCARDAMRLIQRLRGGRHRIDPDLSDPQRQEILGELARQWIELQREIASQLDSCGEFQKVLVRMQASGNGRPARKTLVTTR